MQRLLVTLLMCAVFPAFVRGAATRNLTRRELYDRIRGGWVGQMIGNIQGLPFEFKYKDEPGPLPDFTPHLSRCRSDDDTDIEIIHLYAMESYGALQVPYSLLAREWIRCINRAVWVSNKQARTLMEKGVIPPWTSHHALNPHAAYNLSGQFCTELYGLLAPGLPRAAARIGSHYARITVQGEPIQACYYWTAMIAQAFFFHDVEELARSALKAVDPRTEHAEMVRDVCNWHAEYPGDWRRTRAAIQQKYRDARKWNMNATVTNGAFVLTALLYGGGDFAQTLKLAFALGYDADCNGATCGAVLGVLHGAEALAAHPGWVLPSQYDNTTREGLPASIPIEEIVELTLRRAEQVIFGEGGSRRGEGDGAVYSIPLQPPALNGRFELTYSPESRDTIGEALRRYALRNMQDGAAVERSFAALYLANHDFEKLPRAQQDQVKAALRATASDPVLAPLAEKGLHQVEEAEG